MGRLSRLSSRMSLSLLIASFIGAILFLFLIVLSLPALSCASQGQLIFSCRVDGSSFLAVRVLNHTRARENRFVFSSALGTESISSFPNTDVVYNIRGVSENNVASLFYATDASPRQYSISAVGCESAFDFGNLFLYFIGGLFAFVFLFYFYKLIA